MSARPLIDGTGLPKHRFDARSPIWWGNLWLLAIETTMFVIALAAYLYTQQNFQVWPPPNTSTRFDARSPIWWGNLWLLAIETTMFVIALAAYLYTQQNFQVWPPPNTSTVF